MTISITSSIRISIRIIAIIIIIRIMIIIIVIIINNNNSIVRTIIIIINISIIRSHFGSRLKDATLPRAPPSGSWATCYSERMQRRERSLGPSPRVRNWVRVLLWEAERRPNDIAATLDRVRRHTSGRTWSVVVGRFLHVCSEEVQGLVWAYLFEVEDTQQRR